MPAALEWRVHVAGFAPDHPPFDWEAFLALGDTGRERLRFKHPVDELWRRRRDGPPGWPPQTPACCCVRREGRFEVSMTWLDDSEAALLEALGAGCGLGELPVAEREDAVRTLFRMSNGAGSSQRLDQTPGPTGTWLYNSQSSQNSPPVQRMRSSSLGRRRP